MKNTLSKKVLSFIVCALLFAGALCEPCLAEEPAETKYVYISTEADLKALAQNCRLDTRSENAVVILQNNITLSGPFTPIPVFSGTFDGQGHSINNVRIKSSLSRAGLFGLVTSEAQIRNLIVSGQVTPSGDVLYAGGIAAENYGYIESCVFTGEVSCDSVSGGIAGINYGVINGCANFGEIDVGSRKFPRVSIKKLKSAGINGVIEFITNGTIDSASDRSGGIAGENNGAVLSCKNLGLVGSYVKTQNSGGIAGCNSGSIALCSNYSSIQGSKNVGGIAGLAYPYVKTSYSEDLLSGTKNEIDNIYKLIDSLTYDIDAAAADVSSSISGVLDAVSYASGAATNLSYQATGLVNQKLSEMNEVKSYAETAVTGLNGVSAGIDEIGTDFNNGLKNFSDGINYVKAGLSEEDPDISSELVSEGLSCFVYGIGNIEDAVGGLDDTTTEIHNMFTNLDNQGLPNFAAESPEFTNALASLTGSVSVISQQTKVLSGSLASTANKLTSNVRDITAEAQTITDGIYSAAYSLSDLSFSTFLYDSSGNAFPSGDYSYGIIQNSVSTGSVEGKEAVGGIVGKMTVSTSVNIDKEESAGGVRLKFLEYRSIVSKCKSYGDVKAENDYAGGISGISVVGAITDCEGYSDVQSSKGSYVGGIVGSSHGLIRNCFARSTLQGNSYVGGILGSGKSRQLILNESAVIGNYADVIISGADQHKGGVAGSNNGYFMSNYFVGSALNGIDEFSSEFKAAPITRSTLLGLENCPEEFSWSETVLDSVSGSSSASGKAFPSFDSAPWIYIVLALLVIPGLIFLIVFIIIKFVSASRKANQKSDAVAQGQSAVIPEVSSDSNSAKGKNKSSGNAYIPPWKTAQ